MPFTANRGFKADPRMFATAKDMHYTTTEGRTVLDARPGCGASTPVIAASRSSRPSADRQARWLRPTFQLGHPLAFDFRHSRRALMPGWARPHLSQQRSEGSTSALKIALACQRARGQGTRTRLIGRERRLSRHRFRLASRSAAGHNRPSHSDAY